jgi:hypothetical protein
MGILDRKRKIKIKERCLELDHSWHLIEICVLEVQEDWKRKIILSTEAAIY